MSEFTTDLSTAIPGKLYDVRLRDGSVLMKCDTANIFQSGPEPSKLFMKWATPFGEWYKFAVTSDNLEAIRPSEGK